MKRKELADLLRSYRNDETIKGILVTKFYECRMLSITFNDVFNPPNEAESMGVVVHQNGNAFICFSINISEK